MDPEPQLNLLLELEDDAARARRRESVLLSVITHLAALVVLLVSPMLSESVKERLGIAEEKPKRREQLTYLALPPDDRDDQVVKSKPKTNVLSDKGPPGAAGPGDPTVQIADAAQAGSPGRAHSACGREG